MTFLAVVAHPDDEVLGVGGTFAQAADLGLDTYVAILSGEARARTQRPDDDRLAANIENANEGLGVKGVARGSFPNIALNTVPHLELVQFVEGCIRRWEPTTIFTHHPSDLNDDHRQVASACLAAARLFQRVGDVRPLNAMYYMEVPSATDWAFPGHALPFVPDTFFEIGAEYLDRKITALAAYERVMRPYPHPRSAEVLGGLAAVRGGQAGLNLAEAFVTAFQRRPLGSLQPWSTA